jgi:preprotein translocase subunit YajC
MLNTPAFAETAIQPIMTSNYTLVHILMWMGFGLIVYTLIWRPHMKRVKEHQALMEALTVGDIIQTTGGIIGKITQIKPDHLRLEVTKGLNIYLQKDAVVNILPKGSFKFE